jgi:hypothetical protein
MGGWIGKRLFSKLWRPALGPTQPPIHWEPRFFPGGKTVGAWSWPLVSIQPRVWVSGAIPSLPLHAFVVWAGTTLLFLPVTGYRLTTPSEVRVASNIVERRRVTSMEIQKLFLSVFDLVFLLVGAPGSIMTACSLNWKQTGFSAVLLLKGNVCLVTETISSPRLSVKETIVVRSIPRNKWTGIFQSV